MQTSNETCRTPQSLGFHWRESRVMTRKNVALKDVIVLNGVASDAMLQQLAAETGRPVVSLTDGQTHELPLFEINNEKNDSKSFWRCQGSGV